MPTAGNRQGFETGVQIVRKMTLPTMITATYKELEAAGVRYNTARSWVSRGKYATERSGGRARLVLTEGKALAEAVLQSRRLHLQALENSVYTRIKEDLKALSLEYMGKGYGMETAGRLAKEHAVFAGLLEAEGEAWEKYEVYNLFSPRKLKYSTFRQYMGRIKRLGYEDVIGEGRGKRGRTIPVLIDNLIYRLYEQPKKYNQTQIYWRVREFCEAGGYKTPSLRWVQNKCSELYNYVIERREGKSRALQLMPYTSLVQAKNPNTQWQIDGFKVPLWYKEPGGAGYQTLYLVAVLDSYSGAYVGFNICEEENTEAILSALADAVKTTGYIPAEIVSDNHSFHKTQEAKGLIAELARKGCAWTVDSNPRRKARLERSFKTLAGQHFKEYPGWTGQGVQSRERPERPAPEYTDRYSSGRGWLDRDQAKAIVLQCVWEYNHKARRSRDKEYLPRWQAYKEGVNVHGVLCDDVTRNSLFVRRVEYTVRNGQITINRGGQKREYAFGSKDFTKWNGKRVTVMYGDFDQIDVFSPEGDHIATLKPKTKAFAALADRREAGEIGALGALATASIRRGIQGAARRLESLHFDHTDPEAADKMNPYTHSKEAIREVKRRGGFTARELGELAEPGRLQEVGSEEENGYGHSSANSF